jgi:hypothetical protein
MATPLFFIRHPLAFMRRRWSARKLEFSKRSEQMRELPLESSGARGKAISSLRETILRSCIQTSRLYSGLGPNSALVFPFGTSLTFCHRTVREKRQSRKALCRVKGPVKRLVGNLQAALVPSRGHFVVTTGSRRRLNRAEQVMFASDVRNNTSGLSGDSNSQNAESQCSIGGRG